MPVSGLVTVRLRRPVAAPAAIVAFTVSDVALFHVVEFTVMPVPENAAMAPFTKPVPVTVRLPVTGRVAEVGATEATVGAALTMNTLAPVAVLPSPVVTVTLRAPVAAAPVIVMFAVSDVALTNVVEFTVMPAPENELASAGPLSNPVPVIVMFWPVVPCGLELGVVEVTVGAALTVNTPAPVPVPESRFVTVTLRAPRAAPGRS